jgi:hypothetical protein
VRPKEPEARTEPEESTTLAVMTRSEAEVSATAWRSAVKAPAAPEQSSRLLPSEAVVGLEALVERLFVPETLRLNYVPLRGEALTVRL